MKTHRRLARAGRWGLVLWAVVAFLVFGAMAYADVPVADGDGATPISPLLQPLNLGDKCVGGTFDVFVPVAIQRGAEPATDLLRTFKNSANIVLSVTGDSGANAGEVSENFTDAGADSSITLEPNWTTIGTGTMSGDTGIMKVHLTPTTTGLNKTATVTVQARGPNVNDVLINRTQPGGFKINWNGITCDTDAPVITHSIGSPSHTSGSDTYVTSATVLDFDVDEENNGDSGLDSCTVSITGPTSPVAITGGFTCVEGSNNFTLGAGAPASLVPTVKDGSYLNSASATDNFDNTGTDSFTVILDNSNPNFGACTGGPFVLGSGGGSQAVSITANDGAGSGVDAGASTLSGTVDTTSVGSQDVKYKAVDNLGNEAGKTCTYQVIYDFTGFFPPVGNPPDENTVKAGQAIPIKFSLGGNQGLDIFADGFPKSYPADCDDWTPLGAATGTVAAGGSGLNYDSTVNPPIGQYVYPWKTDKDWADSCRVLEVKLDDGTTHLAYFNFTR